MKTQKYTAQDLENAIRQARGKHGEEAMILTITTHPKPDDGVEVTFAFDMDDAEFEGEYDKTTDEWEKATEEWEKSFEAREKAMEAREKAEDEAWERIENDPNMTEDEKLEAVMKECEKSLQASADEIADLVAGVEEYGKIQTQMAGYVLESARRGGVEL